jgi:hypothetical protein
MQFPIPHITTFVLLFHLGLGCCWHHGATCAREHSQQPSALSATCVCPSQEHADTDPSRKTDTHVHGVTFHHDHSGHKHHCDGDHCTFVRSSGSSERTSELRIRVRTLETVGLLTPAHVPLLPSNGICLPDACDRFLPLRTHLLFGVLLI